jgi:hypothetical protein
LSAAVGGRVATMAAASLATAWQEGRPGEPPPPHPPFS